MAGGYKNGEGNKLLNTSLVANDMLARFKNNLVLTKGVYRDLESQFGEIGDTITVKLPNHVIVNDGRISTKTTPMNDKGVSLVINQQKNVKFNWTMKDRKLSINDFGTRYLEPASNRLANEVDISVAEEMTLAYTRFGRIGEPLSHNDITMGNAFARDIAIPSDTMCRIITNTIDAANITNEIKSVYNDKMVADAIRKGYLGQIEGFDRYFSQNLVSHTVGKHTGNEQVDAELSDGNLLTIKNSQVGALVKGDRFTIAGVREINPITKRVTGRLQTFTVVSDGGLAGATGTITISPRINDGTGVIQDKAGTTLTAEMDKTVDGKALANAAITVLGDAEGTYRENYIMHRDSIAMAMVFLDLPDEAHGSIAHDKQTGLKLNVARAFDLDKHESALRMDVVYGVKMVRPDLILRAMCQKIG